MLWYATLYSYVKAFHITFVIFLIAGLLYLPRIFAYHATVPSHPDNEAYALFLTMEKKLMTCIIHPAFAVVLATGGFLAYPYMLDLARDGYSSGLFWFPTKLSCVLALMVFYGFCVSWGKGFERFSNARSAKFYKLVNEIPAVLVFIIVFMVVLKPFD